MKLHIGTDRRGIVHTVKATDAAVADVAQLPELLHGEQREVFGDQAYWKEDDRAFLESWGIRAATTWSLFMYHPAASMRRFPFSCLPKAGW